MTVLTDKYFINHVGDAVTVDFVYDFPVYLADDLTVKIDSVTTTDYSIAGLGEASGGTITFNTAPANGLNVLIQRELDLSQPVDYSPYDPFPANTHERALDRIVMMVQQISRADGLFAPLVHDHPATQVTYDNAVTGLFATQVQAAIDALYGLSSTSQICYYTITDDAGDGSEIDDLNNTDFTAQTGTTFATINEDCAYIFLHKGTAYHWVGVRNVTVGVGGSHVAIVGQLSASVIAVAASVSYDNVASGLTASNVQDALDEIDANVDALPTAIKTGFKNVLINGDFRVDQTDFAGAPNNGDWTSLAVGEYGYDMWQKIASGPIPVAPTIMQTIEEANMVDSAPYILSWEGGSSGKYVDNVNSIVSESPLLIPSSSIPTGTYPEVILPHYATNIQLERGTVQTDFEVRNIQQELAMCQRFYCVYKTGSLAYRYGSAQSSYIAAEFAFPVTMRDVPSVIVKTSAIEDNCHNVVTVRTEHSVKFRCTVSTIGRYGISDGEYHFDARL